jgi:hypothetical protein
LRRRLWLIDLTLLALVALAGSLLNGKWQDNQRREQALLRKMAPAPLPVDLPPLPSVSPASAANYLELAQQLVFSRDRNPNVILDPPAPPPPPKPMPSLPVAYGVLDLGSGPTVILSERAGGESKGYRVGEKIGEFKLVSLTNRDLVLEWEGKQVKRTIEELLDRSGRTEEPPPPQQTAAAPGSGLGVANLGAKAGPGVELGPSSRACVPNDTTPAGTVQDGYRKVVTATPFGQSCRWEAVQK